MAIQIKLRGNEGTSRSDEYREDKVPATQGNVINTLDSYNEKVKKEYYDKAQARADENALQSSLEKVIKLLESGTTFTNKRKDPNTSSEDTTDDRLEAYDGNFTNDSTKTYDVAGLVQKLNIIANLVSGDSTQANHKWEANAHGNNVGEGESTGSVPVIGLTRKYNTNPYTANFEHEDNVATLKIGGLNEVGGKDVSDKTVLSEKQVSDMISESVKRVLGNYDSQINVMLSYLLFAENGLPGSYDYILKNTTAERIQDAPMYVVYDEKNDRYYIKDLDGDGSFKPTIDYIFNTGNIGSKLTATGKWKVKISDDYKSIYAYYNNSTEVTYTIPVPQKTLTVNLGQIDNETIPPLSYTYNVFNGTNFSGSEDVVNGVATINVPVAAKVTVTLPNNFDGELFAKYNYTDQPENNNVSINNKKFTVKLVNDQTVYAKIIKYTLKLDNDNDDLILVKRYKSGVTFTKTFDNFGKTGFNTDGTKLGGSISNNTLTVSITEIQSNTEYANFTEGEIVDEVTWAPKTFNVNVLKVLWNGTTHSTSTSQKVSVTVSQKIPYSLPVDGYVLNGIFMDENCTTPTNGVLPAVDNLSTLYARYDINKYNYTFIANGAELPSNVVEVGQVDWEATMPELPVLTRNGYDFNGWYTSPNFNGGVVTTYQKADTVYYANWTEKTYTINFTLKGDSLSATEKTVINPYFKYKSINVATSNLPMTIGDPIADGFEFKGWSNGETIINQIDLSSFQYTDTSTGDAMEQSTIEIYATWEAKEVPVKEEIYYQIDGSSSEYDLAKTISHVGTVGQEYVYKNNINVVDGFEEVDKSGSSYIVKDKDNVVKRYFDRKTYNISYTENKNTTDSVSSSLDTTFKYSDNNVPLKAPNEVSGGYSFASWVDENNSEVSYIPAYTNRNVTYTARYNQEAPVEGIDFSVSVDENKITITKLEHANAKTLKISMNSGVTVISSQLDVSYDEVYNVNSLTTAYGFVFFGEENVGDLKIVNASNYVNVLLKFKAKVPVKDVNYTSDANTRTITKIANTVELESRFGDATGYVDFNSLTLAVGQKVALRTKETFSRFASNDTDLIDFGNKKAPIALNKEVGSIKNFEVTKKVSYNAKGEITIKRGVFEGEHGPLQYKTGTGNGWLNVNQAETGNTVLFIDRVGTVYFQYGENAEYNAGSPIEIDVGIQEHTVTFDLSDLNTMNDGYHFGKFTNAANLNRRFTIKVESGSQLCKCDDYIKGVTAITEDEKWGIYGYNMGSEERATSFLKKDGTPFNEASIIDSDITLNMDFVSKSKADFIYTDSVIIDYADFENINTDDNNNEVYSLTDEVLNNFKENVYYGKPFDINVLKSFVCNGERVVSDMDLRLILSELDTSHANNQVVFKGLAVKANNSSNYQFIKDFTISGDTYTFNFTNGDVFPVRDDELFNYKFASLFQLVRVEQNPYFCSLDAVEGGCKITELKAYNNLTITTGFASSDLKYRVSDDVIEFFHKDDIRAVNDALVPDDGILDDTGIGDNPEYITVKFHAALIGGEFKPGFSSENIKYKLRTVDTLSTVINTVSQNSITLQNGWVVSKTE